MAIANPAGELVSVIVPIYNGQKYIERTVRSILNQSYKRVEIILINDGSTDRSSEVVRRIGRGLQVIEQPNQGAARSRNTGLALSKGKYVLFLDQDDILEPEFLTEAVRTIKRTGSIGVVANGYLIDGEGKRLRKIYKSKRTRVDLKQLCVNNQIFTPSQVLMDRGRLAALRGFDTELAAGEGGVVAEDWELWIRLLREGTMTYMNDCLMGYRIHPDNNFKSLDKVLRSELKIVEKKMNGIGNVRHLQGYRYLFYSYKAVKYLGDWKRGVSALLTALRLNPRFIFHPRLYYYSLYILAAKYCKVAI